MIDEIEFNRLAKQGYNRIPLMREVLADLDTPLSTYMKLCAAPYTYLFESVQGGEKWGRYSIIGLACANICLFEKAQKLFYKNHKFFQGVIICKNNSPLL